MRKNVVRQQVNLAEVSPPRPQTEAPPMPPLSPRSPPPRPAKPSRVSLLRVSLKSPRPESGSSDVLKRHTTEPEPTSPRPTSPRSTWSEGPEPSQIHGTWGRRPRVTLDSLPLETLAQTPEPPPLIELDLQPLPSSLRELEAVLESHTRALQSGSCLLPYQSLADWVQSLSERISAPAVEGPPYSLVMAIIRFAAAVTAHTGFQSCGWLSPRQECLQLRYGLVALMAHIKGFVQLAYPVQVQWSALTQACTEVRL